MIVSSKENWVREPFRRIGFGCPGKSGCVVKLHGFFFSAFSSLTRDHVMQFCWGSLHKMDGLRNRPNDPLWCFFSLSLRAIFFLEDIIIGFHQPPALVTKTSKPFSGNVKPV